MRSRITTVAAVCHQMKNITFTITSKTANKERNRQVDMQRNSTVKRSKYLLASNRRLTGKWVELETILFKVNQTQKTSTARFLS